MSCWGEIDFMSIKNAITVGIQVIKSFPVMQSHGAAVEKAVKDLIAGKNGTLTPDLQHQCQAYLRNLTQRKATRPYVTAAVFHGAPTAAPTPAPPSGPAKAVPIAPKSAAASPARVPNGDAAKPNGSVTPVVPSISGSDPVKLRAKLEETRGKAAAVAAAAKEDPK